jgi:CRP-like cAMP-binding protein
MATGQAKGGGRDENQILATLPRPECERLLALTDAHSHTLRAMLYRANGPIDHVYFPTSGVLSLIVIMADGGSVEVGTVGNEGFLGTPILLGADRSPTQVFCQVPGSSRRMRADVFVDEIAKSPAFRRACLRYTQGLLAMTAQSTACNKLHPVNERCARWLLITHDRVPGDEFPMTHEFLAMMLGTRRASVTVAAGTLQQAGLITYHRGHIRVLDRPGLEAASCECYALVRAEMDRLRQ